MCQSSSSIDPLAAPAQAVGNNTTQWPLGTVQTLSAKLDNALLFAVQYHTGHFFAFSLCTSSLMQTSGKAGIDVVTFHQSGLCLTYAPHLSLFKLAIQTFWSVRREGNHPPLPLSQLGHLLQPWEAYNRESAWCCPVPASPPALVSLWRGSNSTGC